ncbi:MAG: SDR family NAD(P)-dependent oxidoreductase [Sphingorhabdus sp.]
MIAKTLAGRTALIVGASSGLGARFAEIYAQAGANVILGARRLDRTTDLAEKIIASGGQALPAEMDVTDEASIIAAFDAAEARFGTVNVIVANAGIQKAGRSTAVRSAAIAELMATNFTGVYLVAREGARRLIASGSKEREDGRIILIGSITADMSFQGDAAYAASKAAVAKLGKDFAREWVRQGVNVNVVQPGYIDTDINGEWYQTDGGKAQIATFNRRRLQDASSLDEMMLFLASDNARAITGSVITIDDGQSL